MQDGHLINFARKHICPNDVGPTTWPAMSECTSTATESEQSSPATLKLEYRYDAAVDDL